MQATIERARAVSPGSPAGPWPGRGGLDSGASQLTVAVGAGIAFVTILAYGLNVDLVHFVGDDGGITLRYAERIAAGLGFDYNDGERVNGCSNPLFTLALSGLLRLGLAPGDAVQWLAAGGIAGAAAILYSTFARFYSVGTGVFVAFACVSYPRPFFMNFNGLEVPFVWLLVACLFGSLHLRRSIWTGLALGLLVSNKLDAAGAVLAFVVVCYATRRKLPWRVLSFAAIAAVPMFGLLFANFGSVLPQSVTSKLFNPPSAPFDPLWMHKALMAQAQFLYVAALATLPWRVFNRENRFTPVLVIQAWLVIHLILYAAIDLGAPYPWYAAVPHVLVTILAGFLVHALSSAGLLREAGRGFTWRLGMEGVNETRAWLLPWIAIAIALWFKGPEIVARHEARIGEHGLPIYAADNLSRQAAGAWLRKNTGGTEWLKGSYGLPAFEYEGPFYDLSLLNSAPDEARADACAYSLHGPQPPEDPLSWSSAGRTLVGVFQHDALASRYVVYASLDSEIVENNARHLILPPIRQPVLIDAEGDRRIASTERPFVVRSRERVAVSYRAPRAPTLQFRVSLAVEEDSVPRRPTLLRVHSGGVEVSSHLLQPDEDVDDLRVELVETDGSGEFDVTLEVVDPSVNQPRSRVTVSHWLVRAGEPLRSSDFKLLSARGRERVDFVERVGMPSGHTGSE